MRLRGWRSLALRGREIRDVSGRGRKGLAGMGAECELEERGGGSGAGLEARSGSGSITKLDFKVEET